MDNTPRENTDPLNEKQTMPKKKRWALYTVLLAITSLLVANIWLLTNPTKSEVTKIDYSLLDEVAVVDLLSEDLSERYDTKINLNRTVPAYKVEGDDFYTNSHETGAALEIFGIDELDENQKKQLPSDIEKALLSLEFTRIDDQNLPHTMYESARVVCQFIGNAHDYSIYETAIECGEIARIKTASKELQPFYEAFKQSEDGKLATGAFAFGYISIGPSINPEYEIAVGGTSDLTGSVGSKLSFYRKLDGEWNYMPGTNSGFRCSQFDTEESRAAYQGQTCYEPDGSGDDLIVSKVQ